MLIILLRASARNDCIATYRHYTVYDAQRPPYGPITDADNTPRGLLSVPGRCSMIRYCKHTALDRVNQVCGERQYAAVHSLLVGLWPRAEPIIMEPCEQPAQHGKEI